MLLHILNKFLRLRPVLNSPIFKIPFIHVIVTFIVNIKNLFILYLGGEIYLAVSWYIFVYFILHIHLISHFCVPHLKFLEPKWSQIYS